MVSQIQKYVEAVKRGPIGTKCCTHVHIHLGMDICQQIALRDTRWHLGGLGGQLFIMYVYSDLENQYGGLYAL